MVALWHKNIILVNALKIQQFLIQNKVNILKMLAIPT